MVKNDKNIAYLKKVNVRLDEWDEEDISELLEDMMYDFGVVYGDRDLYYIKEEIIHVPALLIGNRGDNYMALVELRNADINNVGNVHVLIKDVGFMTVSEYIDYLGEEFAGDFLPYEYRLYTDN